MTSQFRMREKIAPDQAPWGHSRWVSHPASTEAKQIATLDAYIAPGQGHNFHKHPDQEEVLCVIDGQIEQWIDREKRMLGAGRCDIHRPRYRPCHVQRRQERCAGGRGLQPVRRRWLRGCRCLGRGPMAGVAGVAGTASACRRSSGEFALAENAELYHRAH